LSRFVTRFLVVIAAVQILGGHWVVLQTVAWTSMLMENARTETLSTALVRTFDGSKPCSLCLAVKTGREHEDKQELPSLVVKLEAVLAPAVQIPPPLVTDRLFFSVVQSDREVSFAPTSPPPRRA
jgi:hypothetical protein